MVPVKVVVVVHVRLPIPLDMTSWEVMFSLTWGITRKWLPDTDAIHNIEGGETGGTV